MLIGNLFIFGEMSVPVLGSMLFLLAQNTDRTSRGCNTERDCSLLESRDPVLSDLIPPLGVRTVSARLSKGIYGFPRVFLCLLSLASYESSTVGDSAEMFFLGQLCPSSPPASSQLRHDEYSSSENSQALANQEGCWLLHK